MVFYGVTIEVCTLTLSVCHFYIDRLTFFTSCTMNTIVNHKIKFNSDLLTGGRIKIKKLKDFAVRRFQTEYHKIQNFRK